MNVLYVGSLEGTSGALHYYTSLLRLGHHVLAYDPKAFETAGPLEHWKLRLTKNPSAGKQQKIHEDIVTLCRANHFDWILVLSENYLEPRTFEAVRALPRPPRWVYHSHDNNFAKGILKPTHFFETLAGYDLAFTTKSQNVARYRDLGQTNAHFLPSAFEPMVHRPIPSQQSRLSGPLETVFVGTYDSSRDKFVAAVGWNRLHVWGNRWEKYAEHEKHKNRITAHAVYHFQLADILSHSKLALGLLREEAEDLHTQRTFEIPACRGVQLAPRNDEILSFFKEDREILCFEGLEEFEEKVEFALTHPEAAHKISVGGFRRCMEDHHTYEDRVKTMIEKVEGLAATQVAV